jgi:pimeloyl-ACP methyl ester carboxylesterase
MQIAATRPELVERLVVADSVAVYPDDMVAGCHERAATARAGELASLVKPMVSMWFTEAFLLAGDARVTAAQRAFIRTPAEGYARACEALAGADLTAAIGGITAPTTIVCGSLDAAPFVAAAHWLADEIPQAQLRWITGAKHASALERPDEFVEILNRVG